MIDKVIRDYLKSLKEQGLSETTITNYGHYLKHFERFLDKYGLPFGNITPEEVKYFVNYLKEQELKPNTIKTILKQSQELTEFAGFKWMVNNRKIYRERDEVESARPYSELELKTILGYLKENNKIYYFVSLMLYGFGLRLTESTLLLPSDVIEKENQIFARIRPEIAKFKKARETPLILKGQYREDLIDFLIKKRNPKLQNMTLFTYYNDVQKKIITLTPNTIKVYFHTLSKILNINVTAHRFRDTFISTLISAGIRPNTAAKWAGHKDITTTLKFYTKLTTRDELDELNKL